VGIAIDDQVPADVSAVVVPTIHQTLWEQQLLLAPLSIVSAVAVVTIQQTTRDRETLPAWPFSANNQGIREPQSRAKTQARRQQLQFPYYKEYRNRTG